jgi:hypothetical protein
VGEFLAAGSVPCDRQTLEFAEWEAASPFGFAVKAELGEACEWRAEAVVLAGAEGEVRVGAAGDVEAVGVREDVGSRLAAARNTNRCSSAPTGQPSISSGWAARVTTIVVGVIMRSISSTASGICSRDGVTALSRSRRVPAAMRLVVVPCPAMTNRTQLATVSARRQLAAYYRGKADGMVSASC